MMYPIKWWCWWAWWASLINLIKEMSSVISYFPILIPQNMFRWAKLIKSNMITRHWPLDSMASRMLMSFAHQSLREKKLIRIITWLENSSSHNVDDSGPLIFTVRHNKVNTTCLVGLVLKRGVIKNFYISNQLFLMMSMMMSICSSIQWRRGCWWVDDVSNDERSSSVEMSSSTHQSLREISSSDSSCSSMGTWLLQMYEWVQGRSEVIRK